VCSNLGRLMVFRVAVFVLCVVGSTVSPSGSRLHGAGGSPAIYAIAKILLDFTHVPTVSQKATLQAILDDDTTTFAEQVLARALINVEHIASPDDRPKLEALVRDESAPSAVRMLATILDKFTHTHSMRRSSKASRSSPRSHVAPV
jgi:hypothetical protein